jgi:hypothetical protein
MIKRSSRPPLKPQNFTFGCFYSRAQAIRYRIGPKVLTMGGIAEVESFRPMPSAETAGVCPNRNSHRLKRFHRAKSTGFSRENGSNVGFQRTIDQDAKPVARRSNLDGFAHPRRRASRSFDCECARHLDDAAPGRPLLDNQFSRHRTNLDGSTQRDSVNHRAGLWNNADRGGLLDAKQPYLHDSTLTGGHRRREKNGDKNKQSSAIHFFA